MLPENSSILASYVNLKLRDYDLTLDDLCEEEGITKEELEERLLKAGYSYNADVNQFRE